VLCSLLQTLSLSEKRAVQSAMPVRLAASALQSALTREILTQQLVLHQRGGELMPMKRESRKCARRLDQAQVAPNTRACEWNRRSWSIGTLR
jgi:hypothetical protein